MREQARPGAQPPPPTIAVRETPSLAELAEHLSLQIEELSGAEILCGIPCYNSEATVANVVRAVEAGLRRHYPGVPAGIVILDSGSSDRTVDIGLRASTADDQDLLLIPRSAPVPKRVSTKLEGIRGKGNALRPLFAIARATKPKALASFDSDLRSILPTWVEHVLGPVLHQGYDQIAPLYLRHKNDGTITNSIAFPLTAALYGTRVRQPIGGDFGFSGRLASMWAEDEEVWTTDVARFGVDVWMTTTAIAGGYRVGQARLGSKIHDPKDPGQHLGPMFRQVVGTMFRLAGRHADAWRRVQEIQPAATFGFPYVTGTDPVPVDVQGLIDRFHSLLAEHDDVLRPSLASETMAAVQRAANARARPETFEFPIELWIDVVFDLMIAGNTGGVDEERLLDGMIGLYFARTAAFVREAAADDQDEAEARIDGYPDAFLTRKDRLLDRWNASVPTATG